MRLAAPSGCNSKNSRLLALDRVFGGPLGHLLPVGKRQEVEEAAHFQKRLDVVLESEVRDAGLGGMGERAAQRLGRHLLVGDRLHDVRAGHEHVGGISHHDDEVGHGRRIDGTARAGPHDDRDLRDHARGQHVALKDLGITAQRGHALLNARAARVVEPDDRRPHLDGLVHDLANLFRVRLGERTAENREVLTEDEDRATVDRAVSGHHTVARNALLGHVEVLAAVLDEHVPLLEGALVEHNLQTFARRQLALAVLSIDPALAAACAGVGALFLQLPDDVLHAPSPRRSLIAIIAVR
jgi:hypothetical protein